MRELARLGWRTIFCAASLWLAVLVLGAGTAHADAFGELTRWGGFGTEPQQLWQPQSLAVDPDEDGAGPDQETVFVLDFRSVAPESPEWSAVCTPTAEVAQPCAAAPRDHFRLQKLSATGQVLGSTLIPRVRYCPTTTTPAPPSCPGAPSATANEDLWLQGIAVDPERERLYLLEYFDDRDWVSVDTAASRIRVFSTEDLQELPPIALPDPSGELFLDDPQQIAVDPVSHDFVILAYNRQGNNSGQVVVQRIGEDGTPLNRYEDLPVPPATQGVIKGSAPSRAGAGLAIGPDRTVYVLAGGLQSNTAVFSLPHDFGASTVPQVLPGLFQAGYGDDVGFGTGGERWGVHPQYGTGASVQGAKGPLLAISPDGDTLYWAEGGNLSDSGVAAGVFWIRGYSIEAQRTEMIYGGQTTSDPDLGADRCNIGGRWTSVATGGSDGVVWALDHGHNTTNAAPAPWGARVLKFGPGGGGCPLPDIKFSIDGSVSETVTVDEGEDVVFNGGLSVTPAATPTSVTWDFDGDGTFETDTGTALTASHSFAVVGDQAVGLKVLLSGGLLPVPPPATRNVVVQSKPPIAAFNPSTTSPAPGAEVTFDASSSFDPACFVATPEPHVEPCNDLDEYRWDFGDGETAVTDEPTVAHAFANSGASPLGRTVRLTVVNGDGAESLTAAVRTVNVQGTPAQPTCATNPALCPTELPTCATNPLLCPKDPPPSVPVPGTLSVKGGKVSAAGVAGLTASCRVGGGECVGTATLTAQIKAAAKKGKKGKATKLAVGKATFRIAAGGSKALKVRLSAAAKRELRKSGRLKVGVAIETRAGGQTSRRAQTLTLTAAKPKKKAKPGKRG